MVRTLFAGGLGFGLALALAGDAVGASAKEPQYIGVAKCKSCHKKELIGNQYEEWQKSKHAKAFETLKSEKALEYAKATKIEGPPSESGECLQCHATAYGLKPEQVAKKPLKISDGVQCESCHGPGSKYKKKKTMSDRDKAVAAGLVIPDEKTCTGCHNDKSPAWDPEKGFDFEEAKKTIAHSIPEDVKGKYIELEKELRAKKKKEGGSEEEEEEEEE
jgi:hypothetical protein